MKNLTLRITIIILLLSIFTLKLSDKSTHASTKPISKIEVQNVDGKTKFLRVDDFMIIAHRGASELFPEETFPAFDHAIKIGTDFIEFDLQRTEDGSLVAIHDDTVDRTTNGSGLVSSYKLEQLKQLDAGYRFYNKKTFITIPSLDEIFKRYGNTTKYYFETKKSSTVNVGQEKQIMDLIYKYHIKPENVIIESFHIDSLKKMHELNSEIKLVQLFSVKSIKDMTNLDIDAISTIGYGVGVNNTFLTKSFVNHIKKKGLQVHVYTINDRIEMRKLIDLGVTGIFTNNPEALHEIVLERKK